MNNVMIVPPVPGANGVKDIVAEKIEKMLKNGVRYFGSAGASLTHHVNNPDYDSNFQKDAVRTGMEGERSTSSIIRKWMLDKPSAVLLDSVHIRGVGKETVDEETGILEGGDTDHILVIGNEIILIDTKRWKSRRKYSISDKGSVLRSGRNFGGGRIHAKQAKFLWKKYLHPSAKINSIVCINSENVFVQYDTNWKKQPFRLITVEKLIETLNHKYEKISHEDKTRINSTIVSQIVVCCIKPYDGYERVFNMNTLKDFR